MSSPETTTSSSLPFRSKKTLHSNSKSLLPDHKSLTSKTPEKPAQLPCRSRKRKVALSIKEVRRAAVSIGESNRQLPRDGIDGSKSVRRQIGSGKNGSPSSRSKAVMDKREMPEKFEILSKFFDSLDCAIRLLRLKGLASSFSNICPKIECLTDRRFSHGHLAQLKFILPEAVEIKKVLVFDERTSCMKPDLHISLNFSVLDNQGNLETRSRDLRKLFHTRLSEFVSSHPEIDDVPKELLPEPFNRSSQDLLKTTSLSPVKTSVEQEGQNMQKLVGASHLAHSFRQHFSQKVISKIVEKIDQAIKPCTQDSSYAEAGASAQDSSYSEAGVSAECSKASSPVQLPSEPTSSSDCFHNYASPLRLSTLSLPGTPSNMVAKGKDDLLATDSTPAKLVSTPIKLMVSTPAMPPPKRSCMSPDEDSTGSMNKLARRPRSRSLIFDTPTKKDKFEDEVDDMKNASLDDDILNILPESLLQSIREKERKAKEEQMPAISEAKRRRHIIANLPRLSDAIFFLFHKRTVITKEELIHKLVAGHSDIVDRREIEEQLNLLLELVPEWISEKTVSSGDLLMCINKVSSAEMVRRRIEEAK